MQAFKSWLGARLAEGATWSELHEQTGLPAPELMGLVAPDRLPDPQDLERHLEAISRHTGVDMVKLWREAPPYELGPA